MPNQPPVKVRIDRIEKIARFEGLASVKLPELTTELWEPLSGIAHAPLKVEKIADQILQISATPQGGVRLFALGTPGEVASVDYSTVDLSSFRLGEEIANRSGFRIKVRALNGAAGSFRASVISQTPTSLTKGTNINFIPKFINGSPFWIQENENGRKYKLLVALGGPKRKILGKLPAQSE